MSRHEHNHSCVCEHENVKYCKCCRVVYCKDCNKEWKEQSYWTWTYTQPVYKPSWGTDWYQTLCKGDTVQLNGTIQTVAGSGTDTDYRLNQSNQLTSTCNHKG